MNNTMKITGIKKAVGTFNKWQGAARVYLDKSTGEVWTNIYTAPCWWTEYRSEDITEVTSKATNSMWERDNITTMAELNNLCEAEFL